MSSKKWHGQLKELAPGKWHTWHYELKLWALSNEVMPHLELTPPTWDTERNLCPEYPAMTFESVIQYRNVDTVIYGFIGSAIGADHRDQVENSNSVHQLLSRLAAKYAAAGLAAMHRTRQELDNLRKTNNETLQQYLGRARLLRSICRDAGDPLTDYSFMGIVFRGLGNEYRFTVDQLMISADTYRTGLTIEMAEPALLRREEDILAESRNGGSALYVPPGQRGGNHGSGGWATPAQQQRGGAPPTPHQRGGVNQHGSRGRFSQHNDQHGNRGGHSQHRVGGSRRGSCFNCGKEGHFAMDCTHPSSVTRESLHFSM